MPAIALAPVRIMNTEASRPNRQAQRFLRHRASAAATPNTAVPIELPAQAARIAPERPTADGSERKLSRTAAQASAIADPTSSVHQTHGGDDGPVLRPFDSLTCIGREFRRVGVPPMRWAACG